MLSQQALPQWLGAQPVMAGWQGKWVSWMPHIEWGGSDRQPLMHLGMEGTYMQKPHAGSSGNRHAWGANAGAVHPLNRLFTSSLNSSEVLGAAGWGAFTPVGSLVLNRFFAHTCTVIMNTGLCSPTHVDLFAHVTVKELQ